MMTKLGKNKQNANNLEMWQDSNLMQLKKGLNSLSKPKLYSETWKKMKKKKSIVFDLEFHWLTYSLIRKKL